MSKRDGFTLIELLVVISIIALLSSVVVGSLNAARNKARMARAAQFAAQTGRALGDQAVGIWDFDENAGTTVGDRSGFGNDGALNSAGWSADTPSGAGSSGSFDGSRYVLIPSQNYADAITVSAWFKATTLGERTIAAKYDTGTNERSWLIYFDAQNRLTINLSSDGTYTSSTAKSYIVNGSYRDGLWHNVAFSFSSNSLRIFVDGTEASVYKSQDPIISALHSNGSPITIGARMVSGSPTFYFIGQIDEVRIFNKSFAASDIGALYAEGARKRFASE